MLNLPQRTINISKYTANRAEKPARRRSKVYAVGHETELIFITSASKVSREMARALVRLRYEYIVFSE